MATPFGFVYFLFLVYFLVVFRPKEVPTCNVCYKDRGKVLTCTAMRFGIYRSSSNTETRTSISRIVHQRGSCDVVKCCDRDRVTTQ